MKVKFGDLTLYRASHFCKRPNCNDCPLRDRPLLCDTAQYALRDEDNGCLEVEIELPDEEVKKDV